jgi:hypothetical protein
MRTVKVRCLPEGMRSTLVHPSTPLGVGECPVQEIQNVPDEVTNAELIRLWDRTADLTWLSRRGHGRLSFDYSELGVGKIIRD